MADPFPIEIAGLRKTYGRVEALRGLSLQVPAGSIYGFLGRNGAGKTTAIKILLGMTRPTDGTVRVFGLAADAREPSVEIRRRTGFVGEEKDLYDQNRGLVWVIGAFLLCPCHLPLTLGLATTLLAGTTAGVLLRAHPFAAGILITAVWVAGTWRGIHHLRAARRYAASRMTTVPKEAQSIVDRPAQGAPG